LINFIKRVKKIDQLFSPIDIVGLDIGKYRGLGKKVDQFYQVKNQDSNLGKKSILDYKTKKKLNNFFEYSHPYSSKERQEIDGIYLN